MANRKYTIDIGFDFKKEERAKVKRDIEAAMQEVRNEAGKAQQAMADGLFVDDTNLCDALEVVRGIFDELKTHKTKGGNALTDLAGEGKGLYKSFLQMQDSVQLLQTQTEKLQTSLDGVGKSFESFKSALEGKYPRFFDQFVKEVEKAEDSVTQVVDAVLSLGKEDGSIINVRQIRADLRKALRGTKVALEVDYTNLDDKALEEALRKRTGRDKASLEDMMNFEFSNAIDELDELQQHAEAVRDNEAKYQAERAKMVPVLKTIYAIEERIQRMSNKKTSFLKEFGTDFGGAIDVEDEIKDIVNSLRAELKKVENEFKEGMSDLLSGLTKVNVKLNLSDADKGAFEKTINTYIDELNTTKRDNLHTVDVDLNLNESEKTTKRGRPRSAANTKIAQTTKDINKELEEAQRRKALLEKELKGDGDIAGLEDQLKDNPNSSALQGRIKKTNQELDILNKAILEYQYMLSRMDDYDFASSVVSDWKRMMSSVSALRASQTKLLNETKQWRKDMNDELKFEYVWTVDGEDQTFGSLVSRLNSDLNDNPVQLVVDNNHFVDQIKNIFDTNQFKVNLASDSSINVNGPVVSNGGIRVGSSTKKSANTQPAPQVPTPPTPPEPQTPSDLAKPQEVVLSVDSDINEIIKFVRGKSIDSKNSMFAIAAKEIDQLAKEMEANPGDDNLIRENSQKIKNALVQSVANQFTAYFENANKRYQNNLNSIKEAENKKNAALAAYGSDAEKKKRAEAIAEVDAQIAEINKNEVVSEYADLKANIEQRESYFRLLQREQDVSSDIKDQYKELISLQEQYQQAQDDGTGDTAAIEAKINELKQDDKLVAYVKTREALANLEQIDGIGDKNTYASLVEREAQTLPVVKKAYEDLIDLRKQRNKLQEQDANDHNLKAAADAQAEIDRLKKSNRNIIARKQAYGAIGINIDDYTDATGNKRQGLKSLIDAGDTDKLYNFIIENILGRADITQRMSAGRTSPTIDGAIKLFDTQYQRLITQTVDLVQKALGMVQKSTAELDKRVHEEALLTEVKTLMQKRDTLQEFYDATPVDAKVIENFETLFAEEIQRVHDKKKQGVALTPKEREYDEVFTALEVYKKAAEPARSLFDSMTASQKTDYVKANDKSQWLANNITDTSQLDVLRKFYDAQNNFVNSISRQKEDVENKKAGRPGLYNELTSALSKYVFSVKIVGADGKEVVVGYNTEKGAAFDGIDVNYNVRAGKSGARKLFGETLPEDFSEIEDISFYRAPNLKERYKSDKPDYISTPQIKKKPGRQFSSKTEKAMLLVGKADAITKSAGQQLIEESIPTVEEEIAACNEALDNASQIITEADNTINQITGGQDPEQYLKSIQPEKKVAKNTTTKKQTKPQVNMFSEELANLNAAKEDALRDAAAHDSIAKDPTNQELWKAVSDIPDFIKRLAAIALERTELSNRMPETAEDVLEIRTKLGALDSEEKALKEQIQPWLQQAATARDEKIKKAESEYANVVPKRVKQYQNTILDLVNQADALKQKIEADPADEESKVQLQNIMMEINNLVPQYKKLLEDFHIVTDGFLGNKSLMNADSLEAELKRSVADVRTNGFAESYSERVIGLLSRRAELLEQDSRIFKEKGADGTTAARKREIEEEQLAIANELKNIERSVMAMVKSARTKSGSGIMSGLEQSSRGAKKLAALLGYEIPVTPEEDNADSEVYAAQKKAIEAANQRKESQQKIINTMQERITLAKRRREIENELASTEIDAAKKAELERELESNKNRANELRPNSSKVRKKADIQDIDQDELQNARLDLIVAAEDDIEASKQIVEDLAAEKKKLTNKIHYLSDENTIKKTGKWNHTQQSVIKSFANETAQNIIASPDDIKDAALKSAYDAIKAKVYSEHSIADDNYDEEKYANHMRAIIMNELAKHIEANISESQAKAAFAKVADDARKQLSGYDVQEETTVIKEVDGEGFVINDNGETVPVKKRVAERKMVTRHIAGIEEQIAAENEYQQSMQKVIDKNKQDGQITNEMIDAKRDHTEETRKAAAIVRASNGESEGQTVPTQESDVSKTPTGQLPVTNGYYEYTQGTAGGDGIVYDIDLSELAKEITLGRVEDVLGKIYAVLTGNQKYANTSIKNAEARIAEIDKEINAIKQPGLKSGEDDSITMADGRVITKAEFDAAFEKFLGTVRRPGLINDNRDYILGKLGGYKGGLTDVDKQSLENIFALIVNSDAFDEHVRQRFKSVSGKDTSDSGQTSSESISSDMADSVQSADNLKTQLIEAANAVKSVIGSFRGRKDETKAKFYADNIANNEELRAQANLLRENKHNLTKEQLAVYDKLLDLRNAYNGITRKTPVSQDDYTSVDFVTKLVNQRMQEAGIGGAIPENLIQEAVDHWIADMKEDGAPDAKAYIEDAIKRYIDSFFGMMYQAAGQVTAPTDASHGSEESTPTEEQIDEGEVKPSADQLANELLEIVRKSVQELGLTATEEQMRKLAQKSANKIRDKGDASAEAAVRRIGKDAFETLLRDKFAAKPKVERDSTADNQAKIAALEAEKAALQQQVNENISDEQTDGGLLGLIAELAKETTLHDVLTALQEISKKQGGLGKPNAAGNLYSQLKYMLETGAQDKHERLALLDLETGNLSADVIGENKAVSAALINWLKQEFPGYTAQVHTHADGTEPYFSDADLTQFGTDFSQGIKKQILLTKGNITVLDMSMLETAEQFDALKVALVAAGKDTNALAEAAKTAGATYSTSDFGEMDAQSLVKLLGVKGIESKLTEEQTRSSAHQGVLEEDAKEAADMLVESTGRAIKTTVERVGVELETVTEKTDAKGNKTWSSKTSNKVGKAMLAAHKDINPGQLVQDGVFGAGTKASKALEEYENKYNALTDAVKRFNAEQDADKKSAIQQDINTLLPLFNKAEKEIVGLIAHKDRFLGYNESISVLSEGQLNNRKSELQNLAIQRYATQGGYDNIAFNGMRGNSLLVDVLSDGVIKEYALEVDDATGQVKELVTAENALVNAFQSVNKAMQFNELVMADVATVSEGVSVNQNAAELKAYNQALAQMKAEVQAAWKVISENPEKGLNALENGTLDRILAYAENVINLGKSLQKNAVAWKNDAQQNPNLVSSFTMPDDGNVRVAMEDYARTLAGDDFGYTFGSFDGDTLTYKLTDATGAIHNMTLAWNDMYGQIALRSDKTVSALDPVVNKIQKYGEALKQAQTNGYLDGDDVNYEAFVAANVEIDKILKDIEAGNRTYKDAVADLNHWRGEALRYGEATNKTVSKNKRLYVGVNEVNAVDRQRVRISAGFDANTATESQLAAMAKYETAIENLHKKYNEFAFDRTLYDEVHQRELQKQAIRVQAQGKELIKSISLTNELQQKVENSGQFKDRQSGEYKNLGGISHQLSIDELEHLRATMQSYVTDTLGQGSIENAKFDATTRQLTYSFRLNDKTVADMVVQYDEAEKALYAYQKQERESLTGIPAFIRGFKSKMNSIMQYMMSITSITRLWSELRRGVQYVREIDLAMTELKKVTDETEKSYNEFLETAGKTADKVGSTIQKIVSSTADWARLGYSMEEAANLAQSTSVLLNVSEFQSIDEATSALTSTMQAFGYTAAQSMDVVDVMNQIGNNFAVSSDGIATALQDSASALMTANNSYEEAVSLIAAANRVVQNPSEVGSALRTISLRLRGTSVKELEEAGEDTTGAVGTKSKLRSKLKGLTGIDILTDTGAYKSTYQILLEISKVWKDLTDENRAGALELIAGKNRANVASALLTNTKDLEEAYKSALDAEGSAYAENEKYLDSIQGKIDRFNNAVQSMWNGELDSGFIKGIVEFGIQLVQIVDDIGLLNTTLVALSAISMVKNKIGPIAFLQGISSMLGDIGGRIGGFITSMTGAATATSAVSATALEASVANGALTASQAAATATANGLTMSQTQLTAAEAIQIMTAGGMAETEAAAIVTKLGLTKETQALTAATIQQAVANGALTESQGAAVTAMLLGKTAATGAAAAFKALTASFLPLLIVTAVVAAIMAAAKAIDYFNVTSEELTEQLSELKSELSSTTSELKNVETELANVRDRMSELLAMPSLSLMEKEELERLQNTEAELERQQKILSSKEERQQKQVAEKAAEAVQKQREETEYTDGFWKTTLGNIGYGLTGAASAAVAGALVGSVFGPVGTAVGAIGGGIAGLIGGIAGANDMDTDSTEETLNKKIDNYENLLERKKKLEADIESADGTERGFLWWKTSDRKELEKELEEVEQDILETEEYIDTTLGEIGSKLNGVEYGYGADEQLDYYYNMSDKWENIYGDGASAENTIKRVLSKPQFSELNDSIDEYVAKLKNGDESAATHNSNLINSSDDFVAALNAAGLEAQDAIDYFILERGAFVSDTMDGITNQYAKGIEVFKQFKNAADDAKTISYTDVNGDAQDIAWNDLFTEDDEGEFKAQTDKIAEILKGCDEGTRSAFERLADGVRNGQYGFDEAIQSFTASGLVEASKLIESQLSEMNSNIFKGVELSGVIDSFEEFRAALDDVANSMDILHTAQTQMNNAGRISVKTALDLIASTDNWNECLEIENGTIKLTGKETQVLIQDKLDLAKANLQQALTTVEAQIAEIEATESSSNLAYTMEESTNMAVRSLAGNMAYLTKMMEAYTRIASGEAVDISDYIAQAQAAQKQVEGDLNYTKNAAQKIGTAELQKKKKELEAQIEMLEGIDTADAFKNNYDFDKEPGDKYKDDSDDDEDALDKLKKKYERQLAMLDAQKQYLENEISRLEAENKPVSKSLYEEQIKIEEKKLKLYEQERKELLAQMNTVPKHSDDWWEMAEAVWDVEHAIQESTLSIVEMKDAITQLYIDAFDDVGGAHDNKLTFLDDQKQYIEDYKNYLETLGIEVPEEMYTKLIGTEEQKLAENYAKLENLEAQFLEAKKNGLSATDEEWVRMSADIRQVESDILASKAAMAEWNKEMRDAEWGKFDELMERIEDVESEMDHLAGLFSDDKIANEDGTWTKEGVTQLGLLYQQMMSNESAAEEYSKKMEQLKEEYDAGKWSEAEYYEKLQELKDGQWDAIEATESQKEAIVDLHEARVDEIKNGIEKEIEAYEELIKVKRDELDAERDLYDFRNNIKDQTKDITTLERRIAAMSGSTDAATVAERTRLEAELREKRDSLNDTYYDHSMEAQSNALDEEQTAFEKSKNDYIEQLEQTLENTKFLIEGTMYDVLANADIVLNGINTKADEYGLELSPKLTTPWNAAKEQAYLFKENADEYIRSLINPEGVICFFNSEANKLIAEVFTSGTNSAGQFNTDVNALLSGMYGEGGSVTVFSSIAAKKFQDAFGAGNTAATKFKGHVASQIDLIRADINSENPLLTKYLKQPWTDGQNAANTFSTQTGKVLDALVKKANSTAKDIGTYADGIIADMKAAQRAIDETGGKSSGTDSGGGDGEEDAPPTTKTIKGYNATATWNNGPAKITAQGSGKTQKDAEQNALNKLGTAYMKVKTAGGASELHVQKAWQDILKYQKYKITSTPYYAKGTTGTKKDQWAITDEPQYGDELVLIPGKDGNLSYMRKGTSVIPADISENLMKLGMNPNFTDMNNGIKGINIMTNYVNKPELKLDIENFLHVDNVSQDTMPELKKFVKEQVNSMVKQLNYGLKRN